MKIKKFNEEIGNPSYPNPHRPMKQFVVEDGYSYENVDMCVEIKDFKTI